MIDTKMEPVKVEHLESRPFLRRSGVVIALSIFACGVIGALTGAFLAEFWWQFPPSDYNDLIMPLYGTIGGFVGLFVGTLLAAIVVVGRLFSRNG